MARFQIESGGCEVGRQRCTTSLTDVSVPEGLPELVNRLTTAASTSRAADGAVVKRRARIEKKGKALGAAAGAVAHAKGGDVVLAAGAPPSALCDGLPENEKEVPKGKQSALGAAAGRAAHADDAEVVPSQV